METKRSKIFAKKLLSLFLAVLMAASCFTGALTAFAASNANDKNYHDDNLAANFMAWAETTDEQTCEALLDWVDMNIEDLMVSLLGSSHIYFSQSIVVATIKIDAYLDSVDGIFDLLQQADDLLDSYGGLVGGDVKNIDLNAVGDDLSPLSGGETLSQSGKAYRAAYSAKELVMALAKCIYENSNDIGGKNVIGQFVKGEMDLGSIVEGVIGGDVYELLQGALGMWDGYQWNLVYNIVANTILTSTKWFDEETTAAYLADIKATKMSNRTYAFNFDDVLFTALNEQLLQEVHAEITYPNYVKNSAGKSVNDSSVQRYNRICAALGKDILDKTIDQTSAEFVAAAKADAAKYGYTYNPEIIYFTNNTKDSSSTADMSLDTGCVYLFKYRSGNTVKAAELKKTDNLFSFSFSLLEFAWKTALEDTLGLLHVNYDVDRGHGANFDNQYFYWVTSNGTWDYDDWKSNYSATKVEAWAQAVYADYGCKDKDEFLANVKHTFEYDRSVVDDAKNNWRDVDSTTLFNKLRYNPLADLYFDMQTGPINLYFEQTGIDDISSFFDTAFTKYDSIVAGFNDALVAVTKTIFVESDNIGYGTTKDYEAAKSLSVPTMKTTGSTTDASTIAGTLVSNALAMFEYAANVTDANIMNPFYTANSISTLSGNLTEGNFEEAMIPLLISCIKNISATDTIHNTDWDACKDAEGVAIVALEEYLSFILPDKDYSVLYTIDSDGYIVAKAGQNLFDNAVMPMCRDALGYIISSTVPCRTADGKEWNVYDSEPTDSTTIFEILNSVACYYVSTDSFSDGTTGKAVASLLGVVDANGDCLVKSSNTIWQNLDAIINTLLPAIGTAQYGSVDYYGKASSEDLIYNDLIKGFLDIGTPNSKGKMGLTNLLERLITVISSSPISENKATPHDDGSSLTVMVYNLLADVVNNLFGARYSGQGYDKVMPYADWYDKDAYDDTKSSTPFDSLVATSTLGHYSAQSDSTDKYDTGILGILLLNIYEAFGGASYSNDGTQGCWTGAMFAVEAVNNFLPSFVPSLSDHSFNAATSRVLNASQSGLVAGGNITPTSLDITNESIGLNRFYRDENGNVQRKPRYFMYVKDISVSSEPTGNTLTIGGGVGEVIAPEETLRLDVTGSTPATSAAYTITVTYDVFEGETKGNANPSYDASKVVFSNLSTQAFMTATTEASWAGSLYNADGTINGSYTYTGTKDSGKSNTYTTASPGYGGSSKYLLATTPNEFIIPTSDPSSINNYKFLVKNVSNSTLGSDRSFDGMFASLKEGVDYYPVTDGKIADETTTSTAQKLVGYAAIDTTNGNILQYNRYDYTIDGGETWNRGDVAFGTFCTGFSATQISELSTQYAETGKFATRTHVAWTLDEALASGIVYGVRRTPAKIVNGVQTYLYDAVLLDLNCSYATTTPSGLSESVSTLLLRGDYDGADYKYSISWSTPTPGIYFGATKNKVTKGKTVTPTFLVYDGKTSLEAADYSMDINIYTTSNNNMTGTVRVIVADDSAAKTLSQKYTKSLNTYTSFEESDFSDYDEETKQSESYQNLGVALKNALSTVSLPINAQNASSLGSDYVTEGKTNSTTETLGDKAYKPIPTSTAIPVELMIKCTKGTSKVDGVEYWFVNEECTLPLYSNVPLTSSDVNRGTDPCGVAVEEVNGTYYYVNEPDYETEWDIETYDTPYLAYTTTQKTNANGDKLYKRVSFTCYDENAKSMDSRGEWTYTYADGNKVIKTNDGNNDYRGLYQRQIDSLDYYLEKLEENVNTDIAQYIVEQVSEVREGMNSVNYEVASYEKMVQVAKDAESLIWSEEVEGSEKFYVTDANGAKIYVTLSDQSTPLNTLYEDEDGNLYKDSAVTREAEYKYATNKSLAQINAAIRMYNEFSGYVQSRGYIGDKLVAEVKCASGNDYTALDFTKSTGTDSNGNEVVKSATVTSSSATSARFGAFENGTLVNKGEVVYTDESWNNYIIALANAIEVADNANDKVSEVYTVKSRLQIAENNLTEVKQSTGSDTITVSGQVTIAKDANGKEGTYGLAGVNVLANGEVVATTDNDGNFSAEVPVGTTSLTISGDTTIDRTVTLAGDVSVSGVNIPVVMCDYNKDTAVNAIDGGSFINYIGGNYVYADFNKDGAVNGMDANALLAILGKEVVYDTMTLS